MAGSGQDQDIASLGIEVDSTKVRQSKDDLDKLAEQGKKTGGLVEMLTSQWAKFIGSLSAYDILKNVTIAMYENAKAAVFAGEAYTRLAEIAGTTASNISALVLPSKLAGVSMDSVAMSVARLGKAIGEARLGDAQQKNLLRALGIDPSDSRDALAIFIDVGRSLDSMKDKTLQDAVSVQLLGRGFAELKPLMKELNEQQTLVARTTDEAAKQSKEFADHITKLEDRSKRFAETLVSKVLPPLNAFLRGLEEANAKQDPPGHRARGQGLQALYRNAYAPDVPLEFSGDALGGAGAGAGTPSTVASERRRGDAEAKVRQLMDDIKHYDERVAVAKGFADRYSDAIKLQNQMAEEAHKQGLLSDEGLIKQLGANEDARLRVVEQSLIKQAALARKAGQDSKAKEAEEAAKQANAAIIANQGLTTAKVTSLQEVQDQNYRRNLAQQGAELQMELLDEFALLQDQFTKRQNLLDLQVQEDLITNEQWQAQSALIFAKYEKQKTDLADEQTRKRYGIAKVYRELDAESASFVLGSVANLMNSKSREMFEVGKAAAIGQAVFNTYKAAQGAYAALADIPYAGPYLAAAAAAAAIIDGIARVNAIKSTQFGSSSVSSAGGATPVFSATQQGIATAPIGDVNRQTTVIEFRGGDMFSRAQVEQLIKKINESNRDGGRLVTA
jgi:hypothetical protein